MKQLLDSKWLSNILVTIVGFLIVAAWQDIKHNQEATQRELLNVQLKVASLETAVNLWDRYGQPVGPHDKLEVTR